MRKRIFLTAPHVGAAEREMLLDAFDSNWIAPLGPHVDAFEEEMCEYVGVGHSAALSSGTGALHLALVLFGVEPGDEVWCSTLTFSASANVIRYVGAEPVFIDSELESWNLSPNLLAEALEEAARDGRLPKALIAVDLYGHCADYGRIMPICAEYGVRVVEDAAEALGATHRGKSAGAFGEMAVLSFNGNKIITTSGGGMLLSDRLDVIDRARFLATQARDPAPHYQHSELGYNYRMSNLLAAVGRGQLRHLDARIEARRRINRYYRLHLGGITGIEFMPMAEHGSSNCWLTCLTIDPVLSGTDRERVRLALDSEDIEARPVWKPMHLQPYYRECRVVGGEVSQRLFDTGLCLPSGSTMTDEDLKRVVEVFRATVVRDAGI